MGKYVISSTPMFLEQGFDSIGNIQNHDKFHFNSLMDIQNYIKKYDASAKMVDYKKNSKILK